MILRNIKIQKDKEVYLVSKKIKEEYLEYLPLSTQYTIKSVDSTYDSMENNKCDRIIFSVNGKQITEQKALTLYGKRLIIEYIPETDNDQAVIDKYGSIFNAPAYLVKMVPVFKLDGEVIGKGQAVSLGSSQKFTMRVYSDNTYRSVDNTITAGSVYQITEDMQNMTEAELTAAMNSAKDISESININNVYSDEYLGKILDFAGKMYFAQVDIADNALAEKTNISAIRSLSVGMTGYSVKVYNSWGYPVGINEGSLYIDIDLNVLMAVSRDGNNEDALKYMLTSGIVSSNYENIIWEELTGEESISTINLLSNAIDENQNIYMLCSKNYEQAKNELCLSSTVEAEIASAIHQGKIVLLHDKEMTIGDWNGYGYIITDPDTGSAAYMISGGLNGGSTPTQINLSYLCNIALAIEGGAAAFLQLISVLNALSVCITVGGVAIATLMTVVIALCIVEYINCIINMSKYQLGDQQAGEELVLNAKINAIGLVAAPLISKVISGTSTIVSNMVKNISKSAAAKNLTKHIGAELTEKLLKNSVNPSKLSSAINKLSKSGFSDDTIKFIAENTGESGILWAKRQAKNGIKNEIIEQIVKNANDCTKYTDELVKRLNSSNGYADDIIKCVNNYGDDAIKAVEKSGDNAIYIYKEYGENGLKAVANSGDEALKLINKYGTDDVVKVIADYGDEAVNIIKTYSNDGITALKNGVTPQTINSLITRNVSPKDYARLCINDEKSASKIFNCNLSDDLLRTADIRKANIELKTAVENYLKNTDIKGSTVAICIDASSPEKFGTAANQIYKYNPTITEKQIPSEFNGDYVKYHRYLLTDEAIDDISSELPNGVDVDSIKEEMAKLRNAIQKTKNEAEKLGSVANKQICPDGNEYTFEQRWFVDNCAEIWAARNAILNGAKFDNLIIKSVYKSDLEVHELCNNCKRTFSGHYIID